MCLYPPGGDVGHMRQAGADGPAIEPKGTRWHRCVVHILIVPSYPGASPQGYDVWSFRNSPQCRREGRARIRDSQISP